MTVRYRRVISPHSFRASACGTRPSRSSGAGAVRPHRIGATLAGPAVLPSPTAGPAPRSAGPHARKEPGWTDA
ncbi:hypothetical protein GCM10010151_49810 [Actinoallomurus spadix]|uniref:Uncharacterized protein n=1 Tax=Actinoallomurus spadix TaxID=79912 RepID=A0ABN0X3K6_9ACTN